ncbi:DNA cytosine methyltransferase [Castellaniella sp.]|uniref:DNA cytosine methyltransferase n=1 Tax=Castellaniella sp. TaxID=1955812 RepID=UPI002AFE3239|nr:DNA cytosine methyltransferase [Castellaniella sp.]
MSSQPWAGNAKMRKFFDAAAFDFSTLNLRRVHKLVIDNFAGGGGASEGLEQALGRPVDIAINHDPEALSMHALNHPYTHHICESVWDVDPIKITRARPVGLLWLSPDCKHFSKAKGATPVNKDIRGLAWVGIRWALLCRPERLILENVEEFKTWGPLLTLPDGSCRPDPARAGETFDGFIAMLSTGISRGHPALLEACHFLGIEPDGMLAQKLIDGLGYDIDHRELRASDYATPTTRKRFFLMACCDGAPIEWPLPTHGDPASLPVAKKKREPWLGASTIIDFDEKITSIFDREKPLVPNTLRRVAKGCWRYVLACENPYIVSESEDGPGKRAANLITIGYGERQGQRARAQDIENPLGTVVTANKHTLVTAYLVDMGHGEGTGGKRWSHGVRRVTAPLNTIPASGGASYLVTAFMDQANGGFYEGDGRPLPTPLSTITARGTNQRVVTAYFVKYYSEGGQWQSAHEPVHTLTTKARIGMVQVVKVPASIFSAEQLERARACARLMHEYLPEHFPEPADLLIVGNHVLVDLALRMLIPRELYRAQGFPDSYIINEIPVPELLFQNGRQVPGDPRLLPRRPLSKGAQIRMCGNSVCPNLARVLAQTTLSRRHEPMALSS